MPPCRWVPLFLALLAGCGTTTRVVRLDIGEGKRLVHVPRGHQTPVELDEDDFEEAVAELARKVRPSARPLESARRLLNVPPRSGTYLVEGRGRRLVPLGAGSNLDLAESPAEAELTRAYLRWCERTLRPGDCLRLLVEGSILDSDGKYALAMAIAQGSVLGETAEAFQDMVDPSTMVATIVGAMTVYGLLWLLPEPISKGIATVLTLGLMGYLGVDTVLRLIDGWARLVEEVDRATTFAEVRAAGERYGEVMGENAARIFVMLTTAAVGHTASQLATKLPTLPGAAQVAMRLEAGTRVRYVAVEQVGSIAIDAEGVVIALAPGAVAMSAQGLSALPPSVRRHHIATNKNDVSDARGGPWTPRFKELFDRAGMSLDDEANIVEVAGHQGPHPERYHREVYRRLSDEMMGCRNVQECREMLTRALRELKQEISTPGSLLNRLVTEGAPR